MARIDMDTDSEYNIADLLRAVDKCSRTTPVEARQMKDRAVKTLRNDGGLAATRALTHREVNHIMGVYEECEAGGCPDCSFVLDVDN